MTVEKLTHHPVLLKEVMDFLITEDTKVFFDGTLGLGGHAEAILSSVPQLDFYVASDLDVQHLDFAKDRLKTWSQKLYLNQGNFSDIADMMERVPDSDGTLSILLDLGVCSNHFDDPEKGFSFVGDGPLNMSFSSDVEKCDNLVNHSTEQELTTILKDFGEEPQARKIARKMIEYRQHQPIKMTSELRGIVESNVHPKDRKKALTRVFQAFRIAVNDELRHLEKALSAALEVMNEGDRIGVISYHSLEDRIVKKFFKLHSKPKTIQTDFSLHEPVTPAQLTLLTKKAIAPSEGEIEQNSRARSAKFRVAQKN